MIQKEHRYCSMSLENWKEEVTKQRGEYSLRLKSARLTREKGCSSWPTVSTEDHKTDGLEVMGRLLDGTYKTTDQRLRNFVIFHPKIDGQPAPANPSTTGKNPGWLSPKVPSGGGQAIRTTPDRGLRKLEDQTDGPSSKLNPSWVCSLQGIPSNWVSLGLAYESTYANVDLTKEAYYERCREILCVLSEEVGKETLQRTVGRLFHFYAEEILRLELLRKRENKEGCGEERAAEEGVEVSWETLRDLWIKKESSNTSHGLRYTQQRSNEFEDTVCDVPCEMALAAWEVCSKKIKTNLLSLWENMPHSSWDVCNTLSKTEEIWRSASNEETYRWFLGCCKRYIYWEGSQQASPNRVDELRLLGNGVVPQTAEKAFVTLMNRFLK